MYYCCSSTEMITLFPGPVKRGEGRCTLLAFALRLWKKCGVLDIIAYATLTVSRVYVLVVNSGNARNPYSCTTTKSIFLQWVHMEIQCMCKQCQYASQALSSLQFIGHGKWGHWSDNYRDRCNIIRKMKMLISTPGFLNGGSYPHHVHVIYVTANFQECRHNSKGAWNTIVEREYWEMLGKVTLLAIENKNQLCQ